MAKRKNGNIHPSRIFKTPEELEKVWNDYKEDLKEKEKEWLKVQYVGKEGNRVTDKVKLPYTLEGLKRYCFDIGLGDISEYFKQRDDYHKEFNTICSRIRNEIRENQILGGMNGFYNPSITQRLNNLVERQQTDTTLDLSKVPKWMQKD